MRTAFHKTKLILTLFLMVIACSAPTKLSQIRKKEMKATLALSRNEILEERKTIRTGRRDTLTVRDEDGNKVLIMKAVKDEATGEMVATDIIDAAVITARFRNVAERNGKVDIRFEIVVPSSLQDSRWQLRFHPDMFVLEDSLRLESIIITGAGYRKAQLRGYELYDRYLRSIITDSTRFVDWRNLHIWIARNMPELYRFRNDSSMVAQEEFHSMFGPTEAEAIKHYTLFALKRRHERKWRERGQVFAKYVKAPITTNGVRLDTVLRNADGDFVYQYVQSLQTMPKLRKVDVVLSGEIYEQDRLLYSMPRTEPLTFYISSLSSFADGTERYISRITERRASANTACYVDFRSGKWDIDLDLGHNREEMGRIRGNILELLGNETFDIDSIVIAASASPEGSVRSNGALATQRAASVARHFDSFIRSYQDSVRRNSFSLSLSDGRESMSEVPQGSISFRSRSNGENWPMLSVLVDEDTLLSPADKRTYIRYLDIEDPDIREKQMQSEPFYRHLREQLYPRLRTVKFDFFLHRKGMIKDTMMTTEPDTVYRRGVRYLREREYKKALEVLREYRDFNTAIAYVSLDYNASAMAILKELPRTPQVNYMLALLYARADDDRSAVQCYMQACRDDPSLVFRGNLDPEIYVLKERYSLNRDDDTNY
ncbi:MAG: hypothetical protein IJ623_04420 [Bacteroidales bacterium]|nr:hypothetical protein [Bacteroidales bacterium]